MHHNPASESIPAVGAGNTFESASSLRQAHRTPTVPFQIRLGNGETLVIRDLLRILPDKRITGIGETGGQSVIAKLFIAARNNKRHWLREHQGIELLQYCNLPTPKLLSAGELNGGGYYVLTAFIEKTFHLPTPGDTYPRNALTRMFSVLGCMHAQGVIHEDAHLGNFLFTDDNLFILDGEAVRRARSTTDLENNLALLLAQLPAATTRDTQHELLAAYRESNPRGAPYLPLIDHVVEKARRRRLHNFLKKCVRNCSRFKVELRHGNFVALERSEADFLAPILADPDAWLNAGTPLKLGNTSTLAMIEHGGRRLVIKRYNIKGAGHAVSRCWRPSRAWHSWLEGHRLGFLGIATPRPLALIERRFGPLQTLRGTAWLIVEHCDGESLAQRFPRDENTDPLITDFSAIVDLFKQLASARISHGDLKATNLLWCGNRLSLIDLDAMRQHTTDASYQRAWRKDRARLLRNWSHDSALGRVLDQSLPVAQS